MDSTTPTPNGARVLVTGGTGFLGTHLVDRLLRDGRRVRTTVRTPTRAEEVRAALATAGTDPGDRLEIVTADLSSDDGWPEAVAGCAEVHHVASPFPASQPEDADEVIVPARDGALRVLRAARDHGVRRTVLTSSFAAVGYTPKPGDTYDETDWTIPSADHTPYVRSKVIAERSAWDFVREEGGDLQLTVITPTGIFGPVLSSRLSTSVNLVKAMLDGAMPAVPPVAFGVVDVRDVVDIHVRAMAHPATAGERFLASGDATMTFLELARTLAEHLGERATRVPTTELTEEQAREAARSHADLRGVLSQLGRRPVLRTDKARTVLGWRPRDPETTIVETGDSLLRAGLVRDPAA
ncbi:NAD-dependent epimerase/dehydratase family protein [Streptomyces radicis]|uniref:NAD-dependent epimerase/dehydratase family protein n=1 Tax=Streptomyces radicis TaxID=1750517 RepID=A0A3A9WCT8_9ACTN|nr:NAD-dependent epimerase/dehydratase family protein [Streptomyces radicis]RKN03827.1 NAD-dependent epimerase/dehydratase family protein [Streptomyces radicis]RKN13934.1 NAD-dependent epimerase/dehydratase family protein [Streptomyces radicis]